MSFSYSDSLSTHRDLTRFCIGDTQSGVPLFADEEVNAALAKHGDNWWKAVGELLQVVATSPGLLVSVHDASGRVFVLSRLATMFSSRADSWLGRGA
jgi:hypothetical protein